MALVSEIELVTKANAQAAHRPRPCTAFYEPGRYLQIDTYASDTGRDAEDVKQAIRLDRAGAARLLELIEFTFPDLRKATGR